MAMVIILSVYQKANETDRQQNVRSLGQAVRNLNCVNWISLAMINFYQGEEL
jgi:hypothetical protein